MICNDNTINVETKNNRVNKMTKLHSIHLEFTLQYITLTVYYILKDIFEMISNDNTIIVERKNNRVNKMTISHSIHLEFTLQHIALTPYCILKNTFI